MDACIAALESFENETREIYGEYVMESFAPTGAMESLQDKARSAWAKLKELAHRIWEFIKKIGRAIRDGAKRLYNTIHKSPEVVHVDPKDITVLEKEVDDTLNHMNETAQKMKDFVDDAWRAANDDDPESVDTSAYGGEKAGNESFLDYESATEQAQSFFDRLCAAALEADEGEAADVGKAKRKINISGLKAKISKIATFGSEQIQKLEKLVGTITQKISSHGNGGNATEDEGDAGSESKRQRAWAAILRVAGKFSKFFQSLPARASAFFGRIFKRNGTRVKEYNGPEPVVG